jgi:glycine dehydrogenase subunit 1
MSYKHPWIPMTDASEDDILNSIELDDIDELFRDVPEEFRLRKEIDLPHPHSEMEVSKRLKELASKNTPMKDGRSFLGSGTGIHYIPAVVKSLASRSEFVTSYTSYQAEISQGMLQTLFEYQSLLAELLDLDVVNSSMYDMATSLGEAIRMASRVKRSSMFLVPGTIKPEHYQVANTYAEPADITIDKIDYDKETGLLSISDLKNKLDEDVAGVYIENPSYLGFIETQVDEISKLVHDADALLVAGVNILSLGLLRPPGDYDADIVISEGQPLGIDMSYGGPLLGIFGCKMERKLVYQMPGRLVGLTRTEEEPYEQGYTLTLSAREQHIRREKATSNICTNQALMAVTAAIYTSLLGRNGIQELSRKIAYHSNYAAKILNDISGAKAPAIGDNIWQDVVVRFETAKALEVHRKLLSEGLHGGRLLSEDFPHLGESMLLSITEMHDKEQIDEFANSIDEILQSGGAE